jgi:hypothetical protein
VEAIYERPLYYAMRRLRTSSRQLIGVGVTRLR